MAGSLIKTKSVSLHISAEIGKVSAEYLIPKEPTCLLTLAHGAGAGMNHSFMVKLAGSLADAGLATLRFNFPYMEKKKFRPDSPAVAHKTIEVAIAHAHKTFPELSIVAAGKSFGGRMSTQYISATGDPLVKGIILYGFPLHPAGKPSIERADHLKAIKIPMLFLQGTKDTLATWKLIESVCASLRKATLEKIEGADHSFKAGKKDNIDVLTKATLSWIKKKMK